MFTMPGTAIEMTGRTWESTLASLFSAGGLVLSQVCTVTGLEAHRVQNWVARGFVSPARDKKYAREQLCRIALLNALHDVLPLNVIDAALRGRDEARLYEQFCELVYDIDIEKLPPDKALTAASTGLPAGEAARVRIVLRLFWAALVSAREKANALRLAAQL